MLCIPSRRFGLKTLLAFVSVSGVALGYFGNHMLRKTEEDAAVRKIRRLGGKITYSPVYDQKIWLTDSSSRLTWFDQLLWPLRSVSGVRITGRHVDDEQLAALSKLVGLKRLSLGKTSVSSEGLVHVRNLRRLTDIDLQDTDIDDDSLRHLYQLTNLESLNLSRTTISDEGIDDLAELDSLQSLVLVGTQVTATGVSKLRRMLPATRIHVRGYPESPNGRSILGQHQTAVAPDRASDNLSRCPLSEKGAVPSRQPIPAVRIVSAANSKPRLTTPAKWSRRDAVVRRVS